LTTACNQSLQRRMTKAYAVLDKESQKVSL
jgi:hypothetical protein